MTCDDGWSDKDRHDVVKGIRHDVVYNTLFDAIDRRDAEIATITAERDALNIALCDREEEQDDYRERTTRTLRDNATLASGYIAHLHADGDSLRSQLRTTAATARQYRAASVRYGDLYMAVVNEPPGGIDWKAITEAAAADEHWKICGACQLWHDGIRVPGGRSADCGTMSTADCSCLCPDEYVRAVKP